MTESSRPGPQCATLLSWLDSVVEENLDLCATKLNGQHQLTCELDLDGVLAYHAQSSFPCQKRMTETECVILTIRVPGAVIYIQQLMCRKQNITLTTPFPLLFQKMSKVVQLSSLYFRNGYFYYSFLNLI